MTSSLHGALRINYSRTAESYHMVGSRRICANMVQFATPSWPVRNSKMKSLVCAWRNLEIIFIEIINPDMDAVLNTKNVKLHYLPSIRGVLVAIFLYLLVLRESHLLLTISQDRYVPDATMHCTAQLRRLLLSNCHPLWSIPIRLMSL